MTRSQLPPFALVILVLCSTSAARAQDWARFRGENGAGQSDVTTIPTEWSDADYDWQIELPGIGHSSPVIWQDRLVVTSGDPDNATRYVTCRRTSDGGEIWTRKFVSSPHHLHLRNSYASSTPALDGKHVYLTWATPEQYLLVALDLKDGRAAWRKDLGPFNSKHGFATSPIVHGDVVIVSNEQIGDSFLVAYDCANGKLRWKCPRQGAMTAYSVPCVYETDGGAPQLIFHSTAHGVSGIDPESGEQLWSLPDVFPKRCVSSPFVAGGLIFGTCGQGGNGVAVVAVRPGDGDRRAPAVAYQIAKAAPYVVTPVAYKDLLFVWHDGGVVSCYDVADGKLQWRQRVGGTYSGSPVRVGQHLYCIAHSGEVVVLAASAEYQLVARNDLGEPSRATPAVSGGRMYLRTESRLMSLGGGKSAGSAARGFAPADNLVVSEKIPGFCFDNAGFYVR